MKVFKDFLTGEEFYSDAKALEPVLVDGADTGLVRTKAYMQTETGVKLDVGDAPEGGDAEEPPKLDQFWTFPSIENEVKFDSYSQFNKAYFTPFALGFRLLAVEKKVAKDKDELKAKGQRIVGPGAAWVKANFDELQFFTLETWTFTASEYGVADDKFKDSAVAPNMAYLKYDEDGTPYFYFFKDAFTEQRL